MKESLEQSGNTPRGTSEPEGKASEFDLHPADAKANKGTPPKSAAGSDDMYRVIVSAAEQAGHGILIIQDVAGKEGVITYANRATQNALGYAQDELCGMTMADIIHPDSLPLVAERYRRRQRGEKVEGVYEAKVLRRDGGVSTAEVSAATVTVDCRTGTIVFVTDITQRKTAEDMLRESEEKYRQLVENTGAVLYAVDKNGVLTYLSPTFESLFGHGPTEFVGKRFAEFVHPEDLPASMENFRRVMLGSLDEPWECRMVLPGDAGVYWVQGFNRPIYREGAIVGFQGVLVDITARKQLDALKDQFIGLVSHELRTPLTVIIGALNTALSEEPRLSREETRHLLQDAASEAELLSHILDNLLELSRSRAERLHLQLELVIVRDVIQKTIDKVRPYSPEHQLVMALPRTLPPVRADRVRLERILYNLLDNAVKYSPPSEIRVSARREGREVVISVSDKGPGISHEDQDKLFRPFERMRGAETDGIKGIGLGLLVCRSLVEAHGGRIWLDSEPGRGTTFYFTVPIRDRKLHVESADPGLSSPLPHRTDQNTL